jgi:hypothetical protein
LAPRRSRHQNGEKTAYDDDDKEEEEENQPADHVCSTRVKSNKTADDGGIQSSKGRHNAFQERARRSHTI